MTEQDKQALIKHFCSRDCGEAAEGCTIMPCHEIELIQEFPTTEADSDTISRQAAIDICRAPHMRNADCSDFEMAIMMLPPAQLGTNLAEVGTDCISRQAAINGKICIQRSNGVEIYDDYAVPVEYLEQLPPAQPAPSQVAADIARIVENGKDMRVIEAAQSTQPEIIRCRECKFASGDSRICMKFDHSPIGELDFCSFAERREVTT